jgi:hypothetical membrane protein
MRCSNTHLRWLALTAAAGLAWFSVSVVALHLLCPAFDPTRRFLSEYVRSPYGGLMTANFLTLSLTALCLSRALFCLHRPKGDLRFSAGLFAIAALCLLLLGLFPSDLQGGTRSPAGIVHDRLSVIPFLLLLTAAAHLIRAVRGDPGWRLLQAATYLLVPLGILGVVIGWVVQGGISWTGLVQRMLLAPVLLWLMSLTHVLLRLAREQNGPVVRSAQPDRTRGL